MATELRMKLENLESAAARDNRLAYFCNRELAVVRLFQMNVLSAEAAKDSRTQGILMPLFLQAYGAGKTWLLGLYLDLLKQERVGNVLQARLFTPKTHHRSCRRPTTPIFKLWRAALSP
jgi:hypothetical protein